MPAEFKRAIMKLQLALDKATKLLPGLAFKTAEAKVEALVSDLRALESAIPSPPQSLADVALRAQLVLHWSAESIVEMKSSQYYDVAATGRLVEAVLQLAGMQKPATPQVG